MARKYEIYVKGHDILINENPLSQIVCAMSGLERSAYFPNVF